MDDDYLGGERPGKRGRGAEHKFPFVAAVQTDGDGHPQRVQLRRASVANPQFNWVNTLLGNVKNAITVTGTYHAIRGQHAACPALPGRVRVSLQSAL